MTLIGLDVGTTSLSGVRVDAATGAVLQSLTVDNPAALATASGWEALQDPDAILAAVRQMLSRLMDDAVCAVGLTGQMHGILYVDSRGNAASPLYTWQDRRGGLIRRDGRSYVEWLAEMTGYPLATGFGLVTHAYNAANGLVPEAAVSLCTIADYVAARLAGQETPVMDPTHAAGLGLFDLKRLRFDAQALQKTGVDAALLPRVVPSGTPVGRLEDRIVVATALGDNQASFLGAVERIRDSVLVNVGTGGQLSLYTDEYFDVGDLDTRPFPGGGYLLVGASLCGGKAYAVLERFFRQVCRDFAGYDGPALYEAMNALASGEALPGERLAVDTRFLGTRQDPGRRGAIGGIALDNLTPAHLVLGFLDGIADELHGFFERIPEVVRREKHVLVGAGNGMRKNLVLCERLAERFGLPLSVSAHEEEAAVGAAIAAGVAAGVDWMVAEKIGAFNSRSIIRRCRQFR